MKDRKPLISNSLTGNQMLRVLLALANPHRLRILAALRSKGRNYISQLARDVGISRPLLHLHLNKLEEAGLVTSQWQDAEGERARRYYFITDDGRKHLAAFRTEWTEFASTVSGVLLRPESGDGSGDEQDRGDSSLGQDQERIGEPR